MAAAMRYEVFISYAREDSGWVRSILYEPLVRCRTREGERPRVFLDVDKEGIPPGVNWQDYLAEAIPLSRTIILVYSSVYFSKKMCRWELGRALQLDPDGSAGRITPILLDPKAKDAVPPKIDHINFIEVSGPDWFERLCKRLALTQPQKPAELRFLTAPGKAVAGDTLPPVTVELVVDDRRAERDEEVTMTAEQVELRGTTRARALRGVASFLDLSLAGPSTTTRLVATAEGCIAAMSAPFTVLAPPSTESAVGSAPRAGDLGRIERAGSACFFEDETALLVLGPGDEAEVFHLEGRSLARFAVPQPLRFVRGWQELMLLAAWSGIVHLVTSGGQHETWDLRATGTSFTVPGDAQLADGCALLGLWNGDVVKLGLGRAPEVLLHHRSGVQGLAADGNELFVCGLDGVLSAFEGSRILRSHQLEPTVRLLQARADHLLAVGEERLYRIPRQGGKLLSERPPLDRIRMAWGASERAIALDEKGKALLFDGELSIRGTFHAGAGARIASADRSCRYCVIQHQESGHTLVKLAPSSTAGGSAVGRVVMTQQADGLAVSPSGRLFAVGAETGIRVMPAAALEELASRP